MKTLFLVDGAAGTGKSDLLHYIHSRKSGSALAIPKYTTRSQRPEEIAHSVQLDLRFPCDSIDDFQRRMSDPDFYWYVYGDKATEEHYYGLYRYEIATALQRCDLVFLIVRNTEVARKIKDDFDWAQVVSVFMYSDRDQIEARLRRDGYSEEAIARRLNRQPLAWKDYVVNSSFYDDIIINNSDRRDFETLIETLITRWRSQPVDTLTISPREQYRLIDPLIGFRKKIEQRLERFPYNRNVFLMMKFRPQNELVHEYIAETLRSHGLNCVRADDSEWDITRNVYNPIAALYGCKYGIALFDEPEPDNPFSANVAYELGMMHEQGKECLVLISEKVQHVPFDFVKELFEKYNDSLQLKRIISRWISKLAI